jgi:RNA polymerase sigma factor (sigma-70 family)
MTSIQFSEQLMGMEPSMLSYAYHLRLDREDAKDLVQDTFLKAIMNKDKFVDVGYLKAWTFTIMRNTFINNYRHNTLRKIYCDRTEDSFFINQIKSQEADSPDSAYSYKEIYQSIDKLNDKLRVPFKMYITGLKYREIAESTNTRVGTVKSRIFMARKVLMNFLSE